MSLVLTVGKGGRKLWAVASAGLLSASLAAGCEAPSSHNVAASASHATTTMGLPQPVATPSSITTTPSTSGGGTATAASATATVHPASSATGSVSALPTSTSSSAVKLSPPPAPSEQADEVRRLSRNADRAIVTAKHWMSLRGFSAARALLIAAERRHPRDTRLAPLILQACDDDPKFAPRTLKLEMDKHVTSIKRLGGGKSITLKLMRGDKILGVLKPAQRGGAGGFRGEIASWRLCPLIRCGFHIAYNRRVALLKDEFDAMYARVDGEKQRKYAERFSDLVIHESRDGKQWVQGALEDWVSEFAPFPIERTEAWRHWVRQPADGGAELAALSSAAIDAFTVADARGHAGMFRLLSKHLRAATQLSMARQISNVIVFDFLTNNWDRFSTSTKFVGANCQVRLGRIVSIDNGAAFGLHSQRVPGEKLKLVTRFSRQSIAAIRALREKPTRKRIFRKSTAKNKRRFELFWNQREALLAYVDELIDQHGEAAVLAFD